MRWQGERADRLEELLTEHSRMGGAGVGRRTETQQINWALILQLAAEFQGFARDLHADATDVFASWAAGGQLQLETAISALLSRQLKLDKGNAHKDSLSDAFERFGLQWWPALQLRSGHTVRRQAQLELLNRARNAIAHSNAAQIAKLRGEGYPLTLVTARRWRSSLNGLARTMDAELSVHLGAFFQRSKPW